MSVSVIISLYNKAAHIRRTVDSVLAQTYSDFELVVVDDGSTDGSPNIVRQFADPRIRLIEQVNAGPSAARNRGATEAKYDLLAFLDADDEWNRDFLESVLSLRDRFPGAAVWGTAYVMKMHDGRTLPVALSEAVRQRKDGLLVNYFQAASLAQPIHASSMLVRKDALLKIGGYKTLSEPREDTDVLFRLAFRYPIALLPACKTIYHMDAENRTDTWLWSGNYIYFEHARDYLRETGSTTKLSDDAAQCLGCHHIRGLYRNWLAGNQAAMREIIEDCENIKGYRLKCFLWRPLVWIPNPLVRVAWKLQSRLRGRDGKLPPIRRIARDLRDKPA